MPVPRGLKGPPFLKEWQSLAPEKLAFEIKAYPDANKGLRLDNYLALDPDDKAASEILDDLEREGKLPPTVAWRTWRGMVVRIYQSFDGQGPVKPVKSPKLELRTGAGQYVLIPPSTIKTGRYIYLPEQDPESLEVASLPSSTLELLLSSVFVFKESLPSLLENNATFMPKGGQWLNLWRGVDHGMRDDTATKLAGRLLARGLPDDEVVEIIGLWNIRNEPSLPEKDIIRVVKSIDRAEIKKHLERDRSVAADVRDWVLSPDDFKTTSGLTSTGIFYTSECFKDLGLTSRDFKKAAELEILRLRKAGAIIKWGDRRGCYRIIDKEADEIDFLGAADDDIFPINWPFGLENWVKIHAGAIVILAGEKNAGKTGFLLNVIRQNMFTHKINYFSSELSPPELKDRLRKFQGIDINEWQFKAFKRNRNFADVLDPDAINIIDYLQMTDDFYRIGALIMEMFEKLRGGVAIIGLQKNKGVELGIGKERSAEAARLYLTLEPGQLKIMYGKNWANPDINPDNKTFKFRLVQGCRFIETNEVRKKGWEGYQ